MKNRNALWARALIVAALVVAGQTALAVQPNPTNRIHMTSKPAIVQIVSGWVAQWSWEGQNIQRGMIGSGTGFFIHPDGYILTNAHVVSDTKLTEDEVKMAAFEDILGVWLTANNYEVGPDNLKLLAQKIEGGQVTAPDLQEFKRINLVFLQSGDRVPYEIKAYGAPIGGEGADVLTGKDVAVLKIEIKNAPTLKLGDSDNVQVGDVVWVMGYPAAAESDMLDERSALEPTTNDGKISAKKTSRDGTPILQTNTATTHGNSGGPVINDKGEVIGLLTFRGDTVFGQEVQGFNFIVPVNTAMEFVRQAGTENKAGPVDEKWKQGLEEYWNEYYGKAKTTFTDVAGLFPKHSEAQKLIAECSERIAKGEDKTPPSPTVEATTTTTTGPAAADEAATKAAAAAKTAAAETATKATKAAAAEEEGFPTWAIIAIAGGGVALVLVVVLIIVLSGKKKPVAPAAPYGAAPGAPYVPPQPMPGAAPGYGAPPAVQMPPAAQRPMAGPGAPPPAPVAGPVPAALAATMASPSGAHPPVVARTEMYQAPSTTARLSCTIGPFQGRDFPVGNGFFIGRDPARAQLVIQDSQVSGQHLWIGPAGGRIVVRDVGSTNGTYLNNRADQRVTEAPLNEGDVLALGQRGTVQFIFHA
jgi:serine protease Do